MLMYFLGIILFLLERDMSKKIADFWPFPYQLRTNQIKAFEWLEEQTDKANHLILEAPVGAGKSNIAITYSLWLRDKLLNEHADIDLTKGISYVLTPQRILQEQYTNSFKQYPQTGLASLYGKANYTCVDKSTDCELGSLVKPTCQSCPAKKALIAAKTATNTIMNYKLALIHFACNNVFAKRPLMVMDECHNLEQLLIDFDALVISEYRCKKYDIEFKQFNTIIAAIQWIGQTYYPKIVNMLEVVQIQCEEIIDAKGHNLSTADINKLREYKGLVEHVDLIESIFKNKMGDVERNFVLVKDEKSFSLKRLYASYSFNRIIIPYAMKYLYMSSTILNKAGFCRDLGIPVDNAAFLSLDSEFPVNNRPIYFNPIMRMNAQWETPENETNRIKLLSHLRKVLRQHGNESGIIHTSNYKLSKWLIQQLPNTIPHNIFHHLPESGEDRNSVINQFLNSTTPSILISPSITEGLDLKDDLSRFAIFVKVPYGNLGDQWIKRRMELQPEWYQRKALINIIQGGGRVVRSENDYGSVYIFDQAFSFLKQQTHHMIPKWWLKSLKGSQ
jgi:Rad3-related DNA helicase